VQFWPWALFLLFVGGMLAIDLGVLHRDAHEVSRKEALIWTGFVMSAAIIFNAGVFLFKGTDAGIEWTTGYLIEQALSVDNVFVFLLLFGAFQVPAAYGDAGDSDRLRRRPDSFVALRDLPVRRLPDLHGDQVPAREGVAHT
jgi:hypothetical protein